MYSNSKIFKELHLYWINKVDFLSNQEWKLFLWNHTHHKLSSIRPSLIMVAFSFCLLTSTKLFIRDCFFSLSIFFLVCKKLWQIFIMLMMLNTSLWCLYLHKGGVFRAINTYKKYINLFHLQVLVTRVLLYRICCVRFRDL